jgi:hypothetical protein
MDCQLATNGISSFVPIIVGWKIRWDTKGK